MSGKYRLAPTFAAALFVSLVGLLPAAAQTKIAIGTAKDPNLAAQLIIARDKGPGIPDVAQAMQYGYSTCKSLGVGLPGAKWLMDEFDIESTVGKGTVVTMKKWAGKLGYPNP